MNIFEIIGGIIMILMSVAISLFVLFQESTKGGLASLGGSSESYFGKNPGRTRDALLARCVKWCAVVFFLVTIGVYAVAVFMR